MYSLAGFPVPTTAFSITEGSNFTCPGGQMGWEIELSDRYFHLSWAVRQSLMSIPGQIFLRGPTFSFPQTH